MLWCKPNRYCSKPELCAAAHTHSLCQDLKMPQTECRDNYKENQIHMETKYLNFGQVTHHLRVYVEA